MTGEIQKITRLQGFTLLEILIALMMTATIMGALFGVFASSLDVAQEVERSARDDQMMRMVMDRITRDVRSFVALSAGDMRVGEREGNGTNVQETTAANATTVSVPAFTGYEPDSTTQPDDGIVLMSFPTLASLNFGDMLPGERINEVRYILRPQDEEAKTYVLFRQERPYAGLYAQIDPQEVELADGIVWAEGSLPTYIDETGEISLSWDPAQRKNDEKSVVPQLITWVFTVRDGQGMSRTYPLSVHPVVREEKS